MRVPQHFWGREPDVGCGAGARACEGGGMTPLAGCARRGHPYIPSWLFCVFCDSDARGRVDGCLCPPSGCHTQTPGRCSFGSTYCCLALLLRLMSLGRLSGWGLARCSAGLPTFPCVSARTVQMVYALSACPRAAQPLCYGSVLVGTEAGPVCGGPAFVFLGVSVVVVVGCASTTGRWLMSDYGKSGKVTRDPRAAWAEVLRKEQERQMVQTCLTNKNYPDNPSR